MPLAGPQNGFIERQKGKGYVTSSALQQIGKSAAASAGGGQVSVQLGAQGNGADTTEDVLFTATLPANIFDVAGRCICLQAFGNITATSATKTAKVYFGSSLTSSLQYTTTTTGNWQILMYVWKTGSNTQTMMAEVDAVGATTSRNVAVSTSGTETDTASITVKVTGQSTAATANTVVCNAFIVTAFN